MHGCGRQASAGGSDAGAVPGGAADIIAEAEVAELDGMFTTAYTGQPI